MYHSITFGDKNTWDNWHLVPTSRPVFNPPKQKIKTLEILGGNGIIDLSESLTGYPLYENREGSFEFVVMNGYKPWQEAYSDISDYIHGRKMRAVLEDDPYYYYEGRFSINAWKSDKNNSFITIDYNVAPYKRRIVNSVINIPFERGTTLKELNQMFYGQEPVCPMLELETENQNGISIQFVNSALGININRQVSDGTIQLSDFIFYGDEVKMYLLTTSTGTLTVRCSYGRL